MFWYFYSLMAISSWHIFFTEVEMKAITQKFHHPPFESEGDVFWLELFVRFVSFLIGAFWKFLFHFLSPSTHVLTSDPIAAWIWGESRKLRFVGRICGALILGARVSNGNILPHYRTPLIEPSGETRVAVCAAGGKRRKRKEVEKKTRSRRPGVD